MKRSSNKNNSKIFIASHDAPLIMIESDADKKLFDQIIQDKFFRNVQWIP